MSLATRLNRTCTIVKRSDSAQSDPYGNKKPTETTTETAVCELQQQQRSERAESDEVSESRWLLVLPKDTAIKTGDAVVVDGEEYELIGDPWRARNPRTKVVSHIECTLRRTAAPGDEVGS